MRVKADQEQLRGIVTLLAFMLAHSKPHKSFDKNFDKVAFATSKLIFDHVKKLFQKLRGKSETTCLGTFNFSLNEVEALSLYAFVQAIGLPTVEYEFECIKLQLIINAIDKEYV